MATDKTQIKLAWGNYSNLPTGETGKQTEVGALYFTKDEGSLYLGVAADQPPQRVQGVVQSFSSYEEWKTKTSAPYPTDIIYYIADRNLLARWVPNKDNPTTGEFIALNVTYNEFDALNTVVSGHTQTLETHTTTIGQHTTTIGQHTTTIGQHEKKIAAILEFMGTEDSSGTGTLVSRVKALEDWKSNAEQDLEDLDGRITQLSSDFLAGKQTLEQNIATTNTNLSNFQTSANKTHEELQDAIDTLNASVEDCITKTDANKAHDNIISYVDSVMQAANCLQFKSGVADSADIDAIEVKSDNKIGDTYVVTANFSATIKIENNSSENSVDLYAGDLLIVNSTSGSEESDGFILPANFVWHLVETGYQETHDPILATWSNNDSTEDAPIAENEVIVTLTSLGEANTSYGDRGIFAIKSSGNINLSKDTSATDRDTYNFELCWDTF